MKLINRQPLLLLIVFSTLVLLASSSKVQAKLKFQMKLKALLDSDSILKRIRDIIHDLSNAKLKTHNLNVKKRIAGALPDGYPKEMIENAKRMHLDKKKWAPLMSYPTEVWRFCLFPQFKVNYKNWCVSQFMTGEKEELTCKSFRA